MTDSENMQDNENTQHVEDTSSGGETNDNSDVATLKAEAKKLRQSRAALAAERDEHRASAQRTAETVARLQRREVERLAGDMLSQASDFWLLAGDDLDQWVDPETGDVNAAAVRDRAAEEARKRPGMRRNPARRDPDQGKGNGHVDDMSFGQQMRHGMQGA